MTAQRPFVSGRTSSRQRAHLRRGRPPASPIASSLLGTSAPAAITTTALDLPLVQRLRRSPRFRARVGPGFDREKAQQVAAALKEGGRGVTLGGISIKELFEEVRS